MSAFAAILRRDREPVSESALAAMAEALSHRGPNGRDRFVEAPLAAVHLHGWTTPEERGERQPLVTDRRVLLFDGRLDNREVLLAELGLEARDGRAPSDAEIVLAGHAAHGDDFCRAMIGPFALALFDRASGRALLARDPLGDRSLFYSSTDSELRIGSEESALLAHPEVRADLDEARLAQFFSLQVPTGGSTFFRAVRELPPGHLLRVGGSSIHLESFWSPATKPLSLHEDGDLAEEFARLLVEAVSCRLRSEQPAAVLMSGGLDSTSLAALGAEVLSKDGNGLRTVSWVFSDSRLDERRFIGAVVERPGIEALEIDGDGLGPVIDAVQIAVNPNSPEESPYRRLKSAAYAAAASAGTVVLLSGGSADALYTGFESWFADLWREGRRLAALRELALELPRFGARTALRRAGFGRLVTRPGGRRRSAPAWLTPAALELLAASPIEAEAPVRLRAVAGPRAARSISLEVANAGRAGIDLRHPYRDRRLVEFMLRLPAHQLYRHGCFKPIARRAMAGRLPDVVRLRSEPTSLTPLFEAAIRGPGQEASAYLLEQRDVLWPRFVRREWVAEALRRSPGPAGDVALWNCLAFELWRRRFSR